MAARSPDDASVRDRWLELAVRRMTAAGLRAGAARTAVVETLAREGRSPLTAAEITSLLGHGGAGSTASVYRVIEELWDLGLLHRRDGRDGVARFEIAVPDQDTAGPSTGAPVGAPAGRTEIPARRPQRAARAAPGQAAGRRSCRRDPSASR